MHTKNYFSNIKAKKLLAPFVIILFLSSLVISLISPPFIGPDESNHIKRSYLLSQSKFILSSNEGSDSGGVINNGLLNYINSYYLEFMKKREFSISKEKIDIANSIKWSTDSKFDTVGGTAFYFPLIYTPQAIGLLIGQKSNFTVNQSFKLARISTIIFTYLIIYLAFKIYTPPPISAALLVIPMTLFQMSTSVIDGEATAIFLLIISMFLSVIKNKAHGIAPIYIMGGLMLILLPSRPHMLPIISFLFLSIQYKKYSKKHYIASFLIFLAIISWFYIASKTTIDTSVNKNIQTLEIITYYIERPLNFIKLLFATILNFEKLQIYTASFIGVLGWFDIIFNYSTYYIIFSILVFIVALSFSWDNFLKNKNINIMILGSSITSIILIFFLLLVNWNPHPAKNLIEGVAGRYFLMPMLLLAYAFEPNIIRLSLRRKFFILLSISALYLISFYSTINILLINYKIL